MAPLEYPFMAGKATRSQVETSTSGRGGDTGGKTLKAMVTEMRAPPFKHM